MKSVEKFVNSFENQSNSLNKSVSINALKELHAFSDEDLIPLCRNGNHDAFTVLISRYLPIIKFKISKYYFSESDTDDFNQECWLGFLNSVRKYDFTKNVSFKTFATVCIQNRLKDAVGNAVKYKNHQDVSLNSFTDEFDLSEKISSDKSENDIENFVLEKDFEIYLKNKLNVILSKRENEVLNLFLSGYSYSNMAKKLAVSEKSIDNTLQRIRKKIKSVNMNF